MKTAVGAITGLVIYAESTIWTNSTLVNNTAVVALDFEVYGAA
jgi:hypothetical protein